MTDSLQAAAALVDKLGRNYHAVLPERPPVIDHDSLAADRVELRQIAGLSAGGALELRSGSYDFGPVDSGPGRLGDGDPDQVGFTLELDDGLAVTVGPGAGPLLLDGRPVTGPTALDGRVINAGSARFVVARPRPPRKRDGGHEERLHDVDPWAITAIPGPIERRNGLADLVEQRRRLHLGPEEVRHRIETGMSLWERDRTHPMFGTAVVAMADLTLRTGTLVTTASVPVAIDLLDSTTIMMGERRLQLPVVRHLVLGLAAASGPDELAITALSHSDELGFIDALPHAAAHPGARRLLVVDRPAEHGEWIDGRWTHGEWIDGRWSLPGFAGDATTILALSGPGDGAPSDADVVRVVDDSSLTVLGNSGESPIDAATPVGFAAPMADDLAARLRSHERNRQRPHQL